MSDTPYTKVGRVYEYQFQPNFGASKERYQENQFREISVVTRSLHEAIQELQTGTATGSTLALAPTGVAAGTYQNPVITVGADGRVVSISARPNSQTLPVAPDSGLVLTSTGGAPIWAAPARELPADAIEGQVLGYRDGRPVWTVPTVPPAPSGVTSVNLYSRDLDVTGGPVTGAGTLSVALRPTGVIPGIYTNATVAVDAAGRVVFAQSAPIDADPPLDGTYAYWRVVFPGGLSSIPPEIGTATFAEFPGGPDLGGTETRDLAEITRTFTEEVPVGAITLTVPDASKAPKTVILQASFEGGRWFNVWQVSTRNWTDGETRELTGATAIPGAGGPTQGTVTTPLTEQFWTDTAGNLVRVTMLPGGPFAYQTTLPADAIALQTGGFPVMAENGSDYLAQG